MSMEWGISEHQLKVNAVNYVSITDSEKQNHNANIMGKFCHEKYRAKTNLFLNVNMLPMVSTNNELKS